ncbi:flagellar protein FlhE [Acerihabitans arboris]|uniref:Flagellar protein FlhE n=1 Tax=Acerihabitans arboris TaxID=2691583 RepID=A0A845SH34_9GAMM|nr:flagellar protein FlhE [Acerihabitans arboris]NDL62627.1 hypothetical protein [Acerihabitans arboris]
MRAPGATAMLAAMAACCAPAFAVGIAAPGVRANLGVSIRVTPPPEIQAAWTQPKPPTQDAHRPRPGAAAAGGPPIPTGNRADGGWQGTGRMLVLHQLGYAKSSPPMRPSARLPDGAQVTSIYWRIETDRPLPPRSALAICMPGKCVYPDGLAGRSDALAGMTADNQVTLLIKVAGRGVITPPVTLKHYQVQVNYRGGAVR